MSESCLSWHYARHLFAFPDELLACISPTAAAPSVASQYAACQARGEWVGAGEATALLPCPQHSMSSMGEGQTKRQWAVGPEVVVDAGGWQGSRASSTLGPGCSKGRWQNPIQVQLPSSCSWGAPCETPMLIAEWDTATSSGQLLAGPQP